MKSRFVRHIAFAFLTLSSLAEPAFAADAKTTVNVSLYDMSSFMGQGPGQGTMGYGMMGQGPGQGTMGYGMMGQGPGQGTMGYGMMGQGQGQGMMGMMGQGRMSIRMDKPTVKSGDVHFAVVNNSKAWRHEMLVVAVDDPNAPLPYDYNIARIPEKQIKVLGEVDELDAGKTGALDLKLPAGSYLLICNIPGHYAAGMVALFTVSP